MEERIATESLILGCIYQDLTLIADINLKPSDFSNPRVAFYYELAGNLVKNIKNLSELAVESYITSNGLSSKYEQYGGYESITNLQKLGDKSDFMAYVDDLKKHILVENLKEKRGFDVYKEVTYNGTKLVPADLLPISTAYDFHNFIQLIFNDIEVELDRKDLNYENLSFTLEELKEKLEGKITDSSRFDVFLDWEDDEGNYKYMKNFKLLDETLGGIQIANGTHIVGATSGTGKTTFCLNLALSLITTSDENILIISNEQQSLYYKNLLMSMICQVVFKQYSLTRKKITRNQFTDEEKKVLIKANKFISEKFDKKLRFLSVPTFNSESICAIIKREKLKNNVGFIILDTFKFEGGSASSSNNIAIELVETSRAIDHIATEYKVGVITPVQLLVSQDKVSYLTSSALSNSKQIKETANSVLLMRRVRPFELDKDDSKHFLKPFRWEKQSNGYVKKYMRIIDSSNNLADKNKRFDKDVIDKSQQHILLRIDKNRNGESDIMILFEIDGASGLLREKAYVDFIYMGLLGD